MRAGLLAALVAGLVACATPPPEATRAIDPGSAEVLEALERLQERTQGRRALRAQARVSLEGAHGSSFARHLLILERPDRLRLEILGLVGQRVAVLASDGEHYDLYRAETGKVEQGRVHPGLLAEVAGVPLAPTDLIALLLGVPPREVHEPVSAQRGADGRLALAFDLPEGGRQHLLLDGEGRLAAVRLEGEGAGALVDAGYAEPDPTSGFPHRVTLEFSSAGVRADVQFRRVELEPSLGDGLFRLDLVSSPGG